MLQLGIARLIRGASGQIKTYLRWYQSRLVISVNPLILLERLCMAKHFVSPNSNVKSMDLGDQNE